jgi:hypothetical protein
MEEQKINPVHTACMGCVFASFAGKTQDGCLLCRTDLYREQGSLLECVDGAGDEFFVVNGRLCLAKRSPDWAKRQVSDRGAAVRKELAQRIDYIIPFDQLTNLDLLQPTLESIRAQNPGPSSVLVVSNQDEVRLGKVQAVLAKLADGLEWSLTDVRERDQDGRRVTRGRILDIAADKATGHFYAVFSPGVTVPADFASGLNDAVVNRLSRFLVVVPDEQGEGLVVALSFHRSPFVCGNKPAFTAAVLNSHEEPQQITVNNVVEKALHIASAENIPYLVAKREDVWLK